MTNMETVAEAIGVILGDDFYIVGQPYSYLLTQQGLFKVVEGMQTKIEDDTLELLLLGKLEVDQRFLPKMGVAYFVPKLTGVESIPWQNSELDRYYFDHFLVYETYDEAKALWDIILKEAEDYRNGIEKSKAKA